MTSICIMYITVTNRIYFFFYSRKNKYMDINKKKNQFLIQTAMNTAGKQYLGTSSILQNLTK